MAVTQALTPRRAACNAALPNQMMIPTALPFSLYAVDSIW
ncbi:hypothetical protein H206_06248 [Candidatus Electrothrix aarhusensis]|uniref:Uncharacterized protein n=1 Tax=Candidatus Electrothrix aarhusensis TaxID=1859131 RepID=A0A3S3QHF5_9BACT|nr:hypothetical protein H206_06248 [Candidatus Electrothrix aarhusensis]